jgi:hypothetical protein
LILLVGFGLAFAIAILRWEERWNPLYSMGLFWITLDLLYRASFAELRFFDPDQGGHIYFAPLWLLGVALIAYAQVEKWRSRRPRPAARAAQPVILEALANHSRVGEQSHPRQLSSDGGAKPSRRATQPGVSAHPLSRKAARWSIRLNDSEHRFILGQRLYVVEEYPSRYWERTDPFKLNFTEIDCQSGERSPFPALTATGSFTCGHAIEVNGKIFANAGNRLACLVRGTSEWLVIAEHRNATISGPPICVREWVVCAWVCDGDSLLVSRTTGADTAWSRPIPGNYVRRLIGAEDRLYVFADLGDMTKGKRKTTVQEFDLGSLELLRTEALPFMAEAVEMNQETIYLAGEQEFRVLPPGPFVEAGPGWSVDDLREPGIATTYVYSRDGKLEGKYDSGMRAVNTLLCQHASNLSMLTLQPLAAQETHDISVFPVGVFVSCTENYMCTIERLDSPTGRLTPVACCPGELVGAPVIVGSTILWLVHDVSFEDLERAIARRAKPVTRYRLLSLSWTGRVESLSFDWGHEFEELFAIGSKLILLVGPKRAIAVPAGELGLELCAPCARMLGSRTQGGPRIDLWAYDHPDGFLAGILRNVVQDADEFWTYSPEQRYGLLLALREHWVRTICQNLPAPVAVNDGVAVPAAGGLSQDLLDAGRLLLFEFIRENKHRVPINGRVWPYLWSPFFTDVVSWCNRGALTRDEVLQKLAPLSAKWSTGACSLFDDWRRYRELVGDLLACDLLGGRWRDRLEDALRRVWGSPMHPGKRHVFISYSHRDLEPARRLAVGLESRGVTVAFDHWQPETEVDERQVEMWIAENVISSNAVVYLLSSNARASGWIRRECEWERRLLGLRETFELPLLIALDMSVLPEGYPADNVFDARDLRYADDEVLLNAIATRILASHMDARN